MKPGANLLVLLTGIQNGAEKQNRGHFDDFKNDEQRDQREHARMGIEDEIRAEYSGNRATRADSGNRRERIHVDVRGDGRDAAHEIKHDEPYMPEAIFDVVAEYPEE